MKVEPNQAYVVAAGRTAMARSKNGLYRYVRAEQLSSQLVDGLFERHPELPVEEIDELIWGCANQTLEQGANVARQIVVNSRLRNSVPAHTVNRLCGSSMTALHNASHAIKAGAGDMFVVGGVEHIGHVSMTHGMSLDPRLSRKASRSSMNMGLAAEVCAKKRDISRREQDEFAVRSHRLADAATRNGSFNDEIIPVVGHDASGIPTLVTSDETIRPETNLDDLALLRPVFDPVCGTVTVGTSSQFSDGASIVVLMSGRKIAESGITPCARVVSTGVAGTEPSEMGFGPVPATKKALDNAGTSMPDIGAVEINEAFAAQALACLADLDLISSIDEKVNLYGGAIALGYPFGCSGTRLITTLLSVMRQRDAALGLATMCVGMGQGISTVIERV